jgi:CO/xanthine dehydrogenase FAD-binding subunit
MSSFAYHKPTTLQDAWQLIRATSGARFIAGGTDLMVRARERGQRPPALVSLRSVKELSGIEENGGTTRIGATTSIAHVLEHPRIRERFPALIQACQSMGSPQIRNVATVGGNLCNASPCADTAPPLLIHQARLQLKSPKGSREIPLCEFFCGPGETRLASDEILAAVLLDPPEPGTRALFFKKGRVAMDLAVASVAVLLELDGTRCDTIRVAAGSVAPTPIRLGPVERLLGGRTLTDDLISQARELAAASVSPITDVRSTAAYRRQIVGVYLERAVHQLMEVRP